MEGVHKLHATTILCYIRAPLYKGPQCPQMLVSAGSLGHQETTVHSKGPGDT